MKIVYNNIIPFKGFLAINLFGMLFVRNKDDGTNPVVSQSTLNHEAIHTAQMKELGYILFYIIYFFEWLVRLFIDAKAAYRGISFEKEAYGHQDDQDYLSTRRHFAQWRKTN